MLGAGPPLLVGAPTLPPRLSSLVFEAKDLETSKYYARPALWSGQVCVHVRACACVRACVPVCVAARVCTHHYVRTQLSQPLNLQAGNVPDITLSRGSDKDAFNIVYSIWVREEEGGRGCFGKLWAWLGINDHLDPH